MAEIRTFIRHSFSEESLFATLEHSHRYKKDICVQNYIILLEQRLRERYPDAQIEVISDTVTRTDVEVISEDANGFETIEDSSVFLDDINDLATSVCSGFRWAVQGVWIPLVQVGERFEIPAYNLRWACGENLVDGVEQVSGTWEFALETIAATKKSFPWLTYKMAIVITNMDFGEYEFLDCQQDIPNIIPEENQTILLNPTVLGLSLFSDLDSLLVVSRASSSLQLDIEHFENGRSWDKRWTYQPYMTALDSEANSRRNISSELRKIGGFHVNGLKLTILKHNPSSNSVQDIVTEATSIMREIVQDTELSLSNGPQWKPLYEQSGNENLFCQEVLAPLLRKLGFENVRYTHGDDEYGRDFIFSMQTPFGWAQYYGLQAKVGDISGGANSKMDKIIAQIQDAFCMPFQEIGSGNPLYISVLIIATSGHFTNQAEQKIIHKLPNRGTIGSVHFLDKQRILSLISKYWSRRFE